MHIDFNKKWPSYSVVYNLNKWHTFWDNPYPNTENGDFKHSEYPSIYIAGLLAVHVFDYDVTGVPCEGEVCECDRCLGFIFYCASEHKIPGYVYETENNVLRLDFHSSFHIVFMTIVYRTIEYLNSRNAFPKIN